VGYARNVPRIAGYVVTLIQHALYALMGMDLPKMKNARLARSANVKTVQKTTHPVFSVNLTTGLMAPCVSHGIDEPMDLVYDAIVSTSST